MPAPAVALWLATGGLCFVIGIYLLWRIERSGVRRWGACGRLFGLGDPPAAAQQPAPPPASDPGGPHAPDPGVPRRRGRA